MEGRMSGEAITVNLWGTASSNAIRRTKVGMPREHRSEVAKTARGIFAPMLRREKGTWILALRPKSNGLRLRSRLIRQVAHGATICRSTSDWDGEESRP